jgi:hypothetical protein
MKKVLELLVCLLHPVAVILIWIDLATRREIGGVAKLAWALFSLIPVVPFLYVLTGGDLWWGRRAAVAMRGQTGTGTDPDALEGAAPLTRGYRRLQLGGPVRGARPERAGSPGCSLVRRAYWQNVSDSITSSPTPTTCPGWPGSERRHPAGRSYPSVRARSSSGLTGTRRQACAHAGHWSQDGQAPCAPGPDLQLSKQSTGLDAGQVIRWTSWHRWTAICLLAYIYLAVAVAVQRGHDAGSDLDAGLIPVTVPELLRLLRDAVIPPPPARPAPPAALVGLATPPPAPRPPSPPTLERLRRNNTMMRNRGTWR